MRRIAHTSELAHELRQLIAYSKSSRPSRTHLASQLQTLSQRVAHGALPFRYLPPQARDAQPVDPEGTDVMAYPYEAVNAAGRNTYFAIAFVGKQSKPIWHHSFGSSQSRRDEAIRRLIEDRKARMKRKEDERVEKRNFKTDLFFGDILYTSWGYDQTNVDFYEVIEVTGNQSVIIREIGTRVDHGDGSSEYVVPVPGKYIGPEMKKRVSQGNSVRINSSANAHKWNGKPVYQTGPYGGH